MKKKKIKDDKSKKETYKKLIANLFYAVELNIEKNNLIYEMINTILVKEFGSINAKQLEPMLSSFKMMPLAAAYSTSGLKEAYRIYDGHNKDVDIDFESIKKVVNNMMLLRERDREKHEFTIKERRKENLMVRYIKAFSNYIGVDIKELQ